MTEFTTCGGVLSFMVILSFMVHHMLRVNISIAIVEMAVKNVSNRSENYGPRYDWSAIEKNYILGSYFWGYIITQIPGGRLAERFGSKIVVGVGILSASVLTLLIPAASNIHYYLVLLIRVCLGLTMGVHWPSIPPMAVKWSPPNDISKFMSHMFASALGAGATVVLCGYLIVYFGWPSVFYVTGTLGLLWALAWFYLVYDSPGQHPRISIVEKEKLENKIQNKSHLVRKQKTPWRQIFTSAPVWAIVVSNPCGLLGTFFVLQHLPTYLDQVLHFNIKQNGWISSLPHLARYLTTVLASFAVEKLLKLQKVSKIAIRRFCSATMFWGQCLMLVIVVVWGDNHTVSVVAFTICLAFVGFSIPGFFSNCIDISPAYSGTIFGISQVPLSATGFLMAELISLIVKDPHSFEQWRYIFLIFIGLKLTASIIYLAFATSEEQSWNPKPEASEMEKLKKSQTE